jgi:glycosyltransferase involved in cell wall biosynthesis
MNHKILLLADSASPHTQKWALALVRKGYIIGIFSLNKSKYKWHSAEENIKILYEPEEFINPASAGTKLRYLSLLPKLYRVLGYFQPHIVHAHYATSYGLLGSLSGFHPFVLSVWGSDAFDFPDRSIFHKWLLKFNLRRADILLATSAALKERISKYTRKHVGIVPFGIDTSVFYPKEMFPKENNAVYLGMVKALEEKYGLAVIIEAMQMLRKKHPQMNIKLLLVGEGEDFEYYREKVRLLELNDVVILTGKVPHDQVHHYHNLIDIFLNVSIVNESFGVSVLEAMACGKPVVVSDAPGLMEIVNPESAIIIRKGSSVELLSAIEKLVGDPELRKNMGEEGRRHVQLNYEFSHSLETMDNTYRSVLFSDHNWNIQLRLYSRLFL